MDIKTKYNQRDERWANTLLGFNTDSQYSIGMFGCLITCQAMVACYYGKNETPLTINEGLKKIVGYTNGGWYVWGSILKHVKEIRAEKRTQTPLPLSDEEMGEIRDALDARFPVMLEIDSIPRTAESDMHFVLAVDYNPSDENDIIIVDPWDGKEKSLKTYLGWFRPSARKTIESYTIYEGDVPDYSDLENTTITWDDAEGKRHSVGWYVYEWALEKIKAIKEEIKRINLEENFIQYKEDQKDVLEKLTREIRTTKEELEKSQEKVQTQEEEIIAKDLRIKQMLANAEITPREALEVIFEWLFNIIRKENNDVSN